VHFVFGLIISSCYLIRKIGKSCFAFGRKAKSQQSAGWLLLALEFGRTLGIGIVAMSVIDVQVKVHAAITATAFAGESADSMLPPVCSRPALGHHALFAKICCRVEHCLDLRDLWIGCHRVLLSKEQVL